MSEEELERLRTAYEFEVSLYEGKGEVISFEQWLREKGEDSPIISVDKPMGEVTIDSDKVNVANMDKPMGEVNYSLLVDADKVNTINMDKPSLNQIGMCTLKIGTDMEGGDVTTVAHIDFT